MHACVGSAAWVRSTRAHHSVVHAAVTAVAALCYKGNCGEAGSTAALVMDAVDAPVVTASVRGRSLIRDWCCQCCIVLEPVLRMPSALDCVLDIHDVDPTRHRIATHIDVYVAILYTHQPRSASICVSTSES